MDIKPNKPIKTEEDYDWALAEIAPYFDAVPVIGTTEAERFDVLTNLISAYESKNYPMESFNPADSIETSMEGKTCTEKRG